MLQRPFGLPKHVEMEKYRASPVCHLSLSKYNYKIEASIGVNRSSQKVRYSVLDTGAGPNLIRAYQLDRDTLSSLDTSRELVNLASASNHRLGTLGVAVLTFTTGTYTMRQPFIVVRQLGTDVILGCTYIDSSIDSIGVRKRVVTMRNGDSFPTLLQVAMDPAEKAMDTYPHVSPQASPNRFLKVAKGVCLPPLSETVVLASCSLQDTHLLESLDQLYDRKKVTLSNGVANLPSTVPLRVRVENFSDKAVYLHKNENLGTAIPAPTDIMTIDAESPASDINKASPGNPEDRGGRAWGRFHSYRRRSQDRKGGIWSR